MSSYLHRYRESLHRRTAELHRQRERDARARAGVDNRLRCSVPLTDQIEALMRGLPPAQRNRPWAMAEFVAHLQGRYKVNPSRGDIGLALRQLGWRPIRDWTVSGEGRRAWVKDWPQH